MVIALGQSKVAAVLVDMPTYYHKELVLEQEYRSVALERIEANGRKAERILHRLDGMPPAVPVAVMANKDAEPAIADCVRKSGLGHRIRFYHPQRCYVMDPHTGDFIRGSGAATMLFPEGSFCAVSGLYESGIDKALCDDGVEYAHISYMENLGASLDPAMLAMFALGGKPVLAEITKWQGEEGPLALNMKERGLALLEREQIGDKVYSALKANPEMARIGTNNYMIRLDAPLGKPLTGSDRAIYTCKQLHGFGEVVYPDTRLSAVTTMADTFFVEVQRSRMHGLPGT